MFRSSRFVTPICSLLRGDILKIWEKFITELYDRANRPEGVEVENEKEVIADEKGPYISCREGGGRSVNWRGSGGQ
jgi:hypothetical protein